MEGLTVPACVLHLANIWDPQESREWWGQGDLILAAAIAVVLVVAIIVFHILIQRRSRERILRERREIFRRMVRDCGLSSAHVEILKHLVVHSAPTRPHLVVTSLNFYDSIVDQELARLDREGHPLDARQRFANLCIEARERLFYGERGGGTVLESTKDLLPNQKLRIEIKGQEGTFAASVIQSSESSLTITMPTDSAGQPVPLTRGAEIVCYLTARSDAIYSFTTGVAGIRGGRLTAVHLWHSSELDRSQLRNSVRMSVDVPVRFHRLEIDGIPAAPDASAAPPDAVPDAPPAAPAVPDGVPDGDRTPPPVDPELLQNARHVGLFEGMMRDFSLGGMCMRCPSPFRKGDHLGILLPIFDTVGERSGEIEFIGRVVGSAEVDSLRGKTWNVHVQFVGMGEEAQAQLMINMFRLQRHLGRHAKPGA